MNVFLKPIVSQLKTIAFKMEENTNCSKFHKGWFYKLALLHFERKTEQAEYNQTCLNC